MPLSSRVRRALEAFGFDFFQLSSPQLVFIPKPAYLQEAEFKEATSTYCMVTLDPLGEALSAPELDLWVVFYMRVPFRVLLIKVPYYIRDQERVPYFRKPPKKEGKVPPSKGRRRRAEGRSWRPAGRSPKTLKP